jgi:Glycosyl transferase family group 2
VSNGSIIKDGKLVEMNIPKSKVAQFQIVEYLRAFLTGRTSLSKLNSVLIVNTIGEEMDIIMKLHKKMRDEKRKYKIKFLADPICWTQVPESLKDLRVQSRRWQIGLFDSLLNYKSMTFNPKYGSVGMVVLPYYWLFELIGPIVEFLGYLFIPLENQDRMSDK